MKLCKNCKYYTAYGLVFACQHPTVAEFGSRSLVNGMCEVTYVRDCKSLRYDKEYDNLCGSSGKLYEPDIFRKFLITLRIVDE